MSNDFTNRRWNNVIEEDDEYQEYEERFGGDTFEKFGKKKESFKPAKGKKPRDNFSREQDNF